MIKKLLFIFLFLFFQDVFSQIPGTPFLPSLVLPLDNYPNSSISFAYSFRKLKASYTGFCYRARRVDNNAEADVLFDSTNKASINSICTITSVGTSSFSLGQQVRWSTFISGVATTRVSVWYDQSGNGRNALQPNTTSQPKLVGYQNGLFYMEFTGIENIYCPFSSSVLLGISNASTTPVLGVAGTLMLVATANTSAAIVNSFGYSSVSNVRWQSHLNWQDGNLYFDAGEVCCAGVRAFSNAANNGLWKQYSLQRMETNNTKIMRVSGSLKVNGSGNASTYDNTSAYFGIGNANNATVNGHIGNIGEVILFNYGMGISDLVNIENNQMPAWNSY